MSDHPAIRCLTIRSAGDGTARPCITHRLAQVATLLLLAGPGFNAHASDSNNTTPLLETARALHCAANQSVAETALSKLKSNTLPNVKMPNQWLGTDRPPEIHAATFDIVIDVILNSIERFPDTTGQAESVLLGWNYCAIHHSGKYFDLSIDSGQIKRQQADENAPNQWSGFERLGVSRKGQQRYIPQAFSNTQRSIRQQVVYDWWAIQRNQCLPHPGTGELYYQKTLFGPSKVTSKPAETSTKYPFAWTDDCAVPYTKEEHRIHALKLAQEKAEQERLEQQKIELALALAREQEVKFKSEQKRVSKAQLHILRERLAFQKEQRINEELQRQQESEAAPAMKAQREAARVVLRERARAHSLRKKLKKETAELEAADMEQAEREFELALQRSIPTPPVSITTLVIIKPPVEEVALQQSPLNQQSSPIETQVTEVKIADKAAPTIYAESKVIAETPVKENNTIPRAVTDSTQSASMPKEPEVSFVEEPAIAAAIDWTEQTAGKNLQSTAPQSTSSAFPSGSVPPFGEQESKFKDRKYHGFSGSFALSNKGLGSGSDAWSLTANFGYKPIRSSYFFARSGFTWTPEGSDPTYYWGIGYNDWHTGTWAFELNHWGPLKPGDGLQLEKAVASLSYKFDSPLLKKYGLSSSFSLSGGENAAPAATLAGSWTPKPNWFVRTLITQPLKGGDTTWAYGFGYSDWKEKTWALEYNNWGTNKAFDLNFRENALVTLSWKWGF